MARARPRSGLLRAVLAVAVLSLASLAITARYDARSQPGQIWRRGLVAGEQLHLQDGGHYQLQAWHLFGVGATLESGQWVQLGEVLSLVPSDRGHPPRTLRFVLRDEKRHLHDPERDGSGAAPGALYTRL
jgi:hypothetical protein